MRLLKDAKPKIILMVFKCHLITAQFLKMYKSVHLFWYISIVTIISEISLRMLDNFPDFCPECCVR